MDIIGKNIKYLRHQAQLTQESLAQSIGLNRGNIASYEKGAAKPSIENLQQLSQFFQVDLVDFIEKDFEETGISRLQTKLTESVVKKEQHAGTKSEQIQSLRKMVQGYEKVHQYYLHRYQQISRIVNRLIKDHERVLDLSRELLNIAEESAPQET